MARSNFVKSARTDIYRHGKQIEAKNKRGYRLDRSQPSDKDDIILIKKGESYYWWQFNFTNHKHISKDKPKASQLTQSEFLSTLYGIQEDISSRDFTADDLESELQEIKDSIQELLDETQEKYDNMPEHLQESSDSGNTLQERIEALESWISDLDSVDTDITVDDEDDINSMDMEKLKKYVVDENLDADIQDGMSIEDARGVVIDELKQQKLDEKVEEIRGMECSL